MADVAAHVGGDSPLFIWAKVHSALNPRPPISTVLPTASDLRLRCVCTAAPALLLWAQARASSAYHSGIGGAYSDGLGGGSVPMLPPELAHGTLSLN